MIVLAIDPGASLGLAVVAADESTQPWRVSLLSTATTRVRQPTRAMVEAIKQIRETLPDVKPDEAVIEHPLFILDSKRVEALKSQVWMVATISAMIGLQYGLQVKTYYPTEWMSRCGLVKAPAQQVMQTVKRIFDHVCESEHEADAIMLAWSHIRSIEAVRRGIAALPSDDEVKAKSSHKGTQDALLSVKRNIAKSLERRVK